ncbi:M14 family zinc carboxypeptidase [Haloferacaceae archaeon DSL9]
MRRRHALRLIGGIAGTGVISGAASGRGTDGSGPNRTRWHSYEELRATLDRLQHDSGGAVSVDFVGESVEGRALPLATVGDGATDVFIATEQHGDEPTGTEAGLQILRTLGAGGGPSRSILDELTVHVLLRVNPDGGERDQRVNVEGFDPNRYHDYEPGSDENPVPETQAMIDTVDEIDPFWVADLHAQTGDYVDDDGESVTSSIYWPIADGVPQDAQDLTKQMCRLVYDEVDQGYATITQYPGGTNPAICRNAYGLQGRGSMLIETTGQVGDRGRRQEGKFIRLMIEEVMTLLEGTADGSLHDVDPALADEIPERPSREPWPWDTE